MVINFNANLTIDMGENSEYKDEFIESFKEKFGSVQGADVKVTSDNNKIYVKIKLTFLLRYRQKALYEKLRKDYGKYLQRSTNSGSIYRSF